MRLLSSLWSFMYLLTFLTFDNEKLYNLRGTVALVLPACAICNYSTLVTQLNRATFKW